MTRIGSIAGFALGCLLLSVLFLAACKKKSKFLRDDVRYFREMLRADMDYDDIVEYFGTPPEDLNAAYAAEDGLHIYQYPLYDTTFVRIGFTTKMEYACLADTNANIYEDLIVIAHEGH